MYKLHIIQAEHGDCLLLEAGTQDDRTYILVDGGPTDVFDHHLRGKLSRVRGDRLNLVVLSHVDTDHIVGLQDMVAELRRQRADGESELVTVDDLWMNRFDRTVDVHGEIEPRLAGMVGAAAVAGADMRWGGVAVAGISHGQSLQQHATVHGVTINRGFPDDVVLADTAPRPIQVGAIALTIVGPTDATLADLRAKWIAWLDAHEDQASDPALAANADLSVPNLSSITFVAEAEGRTVLMTGDARGDHIEDGLAAAGLTDADGKAHFDVLKLQHHGSDRNITLGFCRRITADLYVISADGSNDNPDFKTLRWVVQAAHEQDREIEIFVTNRTANTRKIVKERRPQDFGYRLRTLSSSYHSRILRLS